MSATPRAEQQRSPDHSGEHSAPSAAASRLVSAAHVQLVQFIMLFTDVFKARSTQIKREH